MPKETAPQQYCLTANNEQIPTTSNKEKLILVGLLGFVNLFSSRISKVVDDGDQTVDLLKRNLSTLWRMAVIDLEVKLGWTKGRILPDWDFRIEDLTPDEMIDRIRETQEAKLS